MEFCLPFFFLSFFFSFLSVLGGASPDIPSRPCALTCPCVLVSVLAVCYDLRPNPGIVRQNSIGSHLESSSVPLTLTAVLFFFFFLLSPRWLCITYIKRNWGKGRSHYAPHDIIGWASSTPSSFFLSDIVEPHPNFPPSSRLGWVDNKAIN